MVSADLYWLDSVLSTSYTATWANAPLSCWLVEITSVMWLGPSGCVLITSVCRSACLPGNITDILVLRLWLGSWIMITNIQKGLQGKPRLPKWTQILLSWQWRENILWEGQLDFAASRFLGNLSESLQSPLQRALSLPQLWTHDHPTWMHQPSRTVFFSRGL